MSAVKVTHSHTVNVVVSWKRWKMESLLLQITNNNKGAWTDLSSFFLSLLRAQVYYDVH